MKANKALKDFDKKIQDLEKALEKALGGTITEIVKVLPDTCLNNLSNPELIKPTTNEQSESKVD